MLPILRHLVWPCCPPWAHPRSGADRGAPRTQAQPAQASTGVHAPTPSGDALVASTSAPAPQASGSQSAAAGGPAPLAPSRLGLRVNIEGYNAWRQNDGTRFGSLNLKVTNTGATELVSPWTLSLAVEGVLAMVSAWNWKPTLLASTSAKARVLTGKTSETWQAMAPNESANVGVTLKLDDAGRLTVSQPRINGVECMLEGKTIEGA